MGRGRIAVLAAICAVSALLWAGPGQTAGSSAAVRGLDAASLSMLASLGPWPPQKETDKSNPFSGKAAAIRLGERLFSAPGLSGSGQVSCASCHQPLRHFSDGLPLRPMAGEPRRNTPSVVDASFNRWFGWGGSSDSLWAASLQPFLDNNEMGPERRVPAHFRESPGLWADYLRVLGERPVAADDTALLVDIAKLLAAFQETLVSPRAPFDAFRDAVLHGDARAASRYPGAAVRGFQLFAGKARCIVCHSGPGFTNHEFDKVGISVRTPSGSMDWGRYSGAKSMLASRFNALRPHATGASTQRIDLTRHASASVDTQGAFRVPGLRGVSKTAPYMHNGSLASLQEVLEHYSTLDAIGMALASPHSHDDLDIQARPPAANFFSTPLNLTPQEISDLVAFLKTL